MLQLTLIPIRDWNKIAANAGDYKVYVATNINPYQGLKHSTSSKFGRFYLVATNINPYQGLKPDSTEMGIGQ